MIKKGCGCIVLVIGVCIFCAIMDMIDSFIASFHVPSGLKATEISDNSVTLSWDEYSDSDGNTPSKYAVRYSDNSSFEPFQIAESDTNSVTISGLSTDTKYYFKVMADEPIYTGYSWAISVTTGTKPSPETEVDYEPPKPETISFKIGDETFTFVKCHKCDYLPFPINFNRDIGEEIEQDFYIMDTEMTVAQYEALRKYDSSLPELGEFNQNCIPSDRNSNNPEFRDKPLHGVIPLKEKNSDTKALQFVVSICNTFTNIFENDSEFKDSVMTQISSDDSSSASKIEVKIPTCTQWYYAAVAANGEDEMVMYRHLGTIWKRPYAQIDCLHKILLESKGGNELTEIQKTYMSKYWTMLWEENSPPLPSESFTATPEQIITLLNNAEGLNLSDDKEDIKTIMEEMPLTYLRTLLYNRSSDNSYVVFSTDITKVKEGEIPNNWGLYDVHSNVSEVVLDDDTDTGYSIMGGYNSITVSVDDAWKHYLLWYKTSPDELDTHNMPGIRLIIQVE